MHMPITLESLNDATARGEMYVGKDGHFRMTGFMAIPPMDLREDFDVTWSPANDALVEYCEEKKDLKSIALDFFLYKCVLLMKNYNLQPINFLQRAKCVENVGGVSVFSFTGVNSGFGLRVDCLVCVDAHYHQYGG